MNIYPKINSYSRSENIIYSCMYYINGIGTVAYLRNQIYNWFGKSSIQL